MFHNEAVATAMLLGEPLPVVCSCCGGKRLMRGIFGYSACGQCMGTGYDIMCSGTARAMGLLDEMEKRGYYVTK